MTIPTMSRALRHYLVAAVGPLRRLLRESAMRQALLHVFASTRRGSTIRPAHHLLWWWSSIPLSDCCTTAGVLALGVPDQPGRRPLRTDAQRRSCRWVSLTSYSAVGNARKSTRISLIG